MEPNWCELSIHNHNIDFIVTMVGSMDAPDSDRGDFRRRRAVDTSSYIYIYIYIYVHIYLYIVKLFHI